MARKVTSHETALRKTRDHHAMGNAQVAVVDATLTEIVPHLERIRVEALPFLLEVIAAITGEGTVIGVNVVIAAMVALEVDPMIKEETIAEIGPEKEIPTGAVVNNSPVTMTTSQDLELALSVEKRVTFLENVLSRTVVQEVHTVAAEEDSSLEETIEETTGETIMRAEIGEIETAGPEVAEEKVVLAGQELAALKKRPAGIKRQAVEMLDGMARVVEHLLREETLTGEHSQFLKAKWPDGRWMC